MHSPSGSLLFSNSAHGDITTKHTYDLKMPTLKTMSFHSTSYQDTTEGHPALPRYHIKPPSLVTLCTSLHFTCLYSITPTLPPAHIIHEVWWCLNDYMGEHTEESWWGCHCSRTSLQAFNSYIPSRSWMNFHFSSKLFMTWAQVRSGFMISYDLFIFLYFNGHSKLCISSWCKNWILNWII